MAESIRSPKAPSSVAPGTRTSIACATYFPSRSGPFVTGCARSVTRRSPRSPTTTRAGASAAKRNQHALADPQALRASVTEAGFQDVTIATATNRSSAQP
jgi:hypothetical protein